MILDTQTNHIFMLAISYRITRNTSLNTSLGIFSFKKQSRTDPSGMKFLPDTSFPNQGSNMQTPLRATGDSILFPEGGRGSSVLIHRREHKKPFLIQCKDKGLFIKPFRRYCRIRLKSIEDNFTIAQFKASSYSISNHVAENELLMQTLQFQMVGFHIKNGFLNIIK